MSKSRSLRSQRAIRGSDTFETSASDVGKSQQKRKSGNEAPYFKSKIGRPVSKKIRRTPTRSTYEQLGPERCGTLGRRKISKPASLWAANAKIKNKKLHKDRRKNVIDALTSIKVNLKSTPRKPLALTLLRRPCQVSSLTAPASTHLSRSRRA